MNGRQIIAIVAASAILTAAMMRHAGETLAFSPLVLALLGAGSGLAVVLRFAVHNRRCRWRRAVGDGAGHIALFVAICLLGAVASYPDAADSMGFVDPGLARIDTLLGFDWVAWYGFVVAHPGLRALGALAYQAIYVSPALLIAHYSWTGDRREARAFLAAFWLAAVLTLALFPYLPALGPLAYLWRGSIPYMPASALYQAEIIPELRSHALAVVDVSALRGLVGAPSFHTSSAVVYAVFGWRIARLRWPLATLNAAMLLATPVEGTHYLADMMIGALVAIAAVAVVRRLPLALPARAPAPGGRAIVARATSGPPLP